MWFARGLGSSMALLAAAAVAAPGDALVVTGDVVNVRAGPGARDPVLFHVYRDQEAVELTRRDNWVQVQIPDRAADGWIHSSLLQVVGRMMPTDAEPDTSRGSAEGTLQAAKTAADPPTPIIETALSASESEALARFRSNVSEFNARAVAAAGVDLFTGAEALDGGTVRVLVTDAWDWVPEAGQTSYTNALFDRWRAAAAWSGPLRLQLVDPSGMVVREKSGPGTP